MQKRVSARSFARAVANKKMKIRIFAERSEPLSETAKTTFIICILRHRGKFVNMYIYIYLSIYIYIYIYIICIYIYIYNICIYEREAPFRVYLTIGDLQNESRADLNYLHYLNPPTPENNLNS